MHLGVPFGPPRGHKNLLSGHAIAVQFASSLSSEQSWKPSQWNVAGMHNAFWHRNWPPWHGGKSGKQIEKFKCLNSWARASLKAATYCTPFRRIHRHSRFCDCIWAHCRCTSVHSHNGIDPIDIWRQCIRLRRGRNGNPSSHHISSLLAHTNRTLDHFSQASCLAHRNVCHPVDNFDMLRKGRRENGITSTIYSKSKY